MGVNSSGLSGFLHLPTMQLVGQLVSVVYFWLFLF